MSLNLTCLNSSSFNLPIPLIRNPSYNFNHSPYELNENNFIQKILYSSFPLNDLELFLNNNKYSLDLPIFLETKLFLSILNYTSSSSILFILLSTIFYIISYFKFQKSKFHFIIILLLINLIFFIQMLFIINRVHKTKLSIEKSFKTIVEEIYPKDILKYSYYLIQQLKQLDNYTIQPNSIVVLGLKSTVINSLNCLLEEKYFITDFLNSFNNINTNVQQLKNLTISQPALTNMLDSFIDPYKNVSDNLVNHIHNYTEGDNIDTQIFNELSVVHKKIQYYIQLLDENLIQKIYSNLLDEEKLKKFYKYITLIEYFINYSLIIITVIPMIFILLHIFSYWKNKRNIQYKNINSVYSPHIQNVNAIDTNGMFNKSLSSINNSLYYYLFLQLIRIIFAFITIIIIILSLITGFLYGLDSFFQGSCRIIHYNQSFLISYATNDSNMNKTIFNVINDCDENIHFSDNLLSNSYNKLNNQLNLIMKNNDEMIYKEFVRINNKTNIASVSHLLHGIPLPPNINNHLTSIQNDIGYIHNKSKEIILHNSKLSSNFFDKFEIFLKKLIHSTIDSCPLPLNIIHTLDECICHKTAKLINGLWFSLFSFIFTITIAVYIFGIYIYKQRD
ncbi:unnamed protein product [Adineta steineri]|uniref:Uncharacterized protein n=4 Tax=Adineta steineri TaxID=433720 RepID=A0A814SAF6_9BILA|nr:unnamed protein product [Adineta steineri]